jgi:hypothetical protein
MRWLLVTVLLWIATPAFAEIQIESEYPPYKPIVATVAIPDTPADVKQQTIARWRISGQAERVLVDDGRTVHIWAPPGTYDVVAELISVNWSDQTIRFEEHTASFSVSSPDPPPTPPTPPTPTPTNLWVTVVEETAERTIEQGRIYTNDQLHAYLDAHKHQWRIVDDDVTDEDGATPGGVATYLARARGKPLPWVVVADATGEVLWEGTLPGTVGALLNTLKQYGGD